MSTFHTTQLAPNIRRVWHDPSGAFERLHDPALARWARGRLADATAAAEVEDMAAAATLLDANGAPLAIPLEFVVDAAGGVRIAFALQPGERLYGAYDADAPGLDRRGSRVHLVNELHPEGIHRMSRRWERFATPADLARARRLRAADAAGAPREQLVETDDNDGSDGSTGTPGDAQAHIQTHIDVVSADTRTADEMIAVGGMEIGQFSNYGELAVPLVISSRGYAVYVSNVTHDAMLDLGASRDDRWSFEADRGAADVYLLGPGTLPELVAAYHRLSGHQPMPPTWSLGYLQSRFGYESFDHAHEVLARFDREQLPMHGMVFDVQWLREHIDLNWDPTNFPDPAANLQTIADGTPGPRVVVITEPGTRIDASNYTSGVEAQVFATDGNGQPYPADQWWAGRGIIGYRDLEPSEGRLINFFADRAGDWWHAQHEHLLAEGVDGWWLDLNEPEDVPEDVAFPDVDFPQVAARLDGRDVRNLFALAQQRSFFHRDRAVSTRRPFLLSRSGSAGSQRYGTAPWSGDIGATWHDLQRQPHLAMSAGLCGLPLWGCDIGGFGGNPGPELFARWMQVGAFLPIFRAHGYMADREPWSQGDAALAAIRPALELRARLLPSIVTWTREALVAGAPLLKPLSWEWPDDERLASVEDQWLFGPLLVAPVLEQGATTRRVVLPESAGAWVDLRSGERHMGGGTVALEVDLVTCPVFVPERTLLVVDPEPLDRRSRTWPPSQLEAWSFAEDTTQEPARGALYVDDGITRLHEQGAYCLLDLALHGDELLLERRAGSWPAPRVRVVTGRTFGSVTAATS